MTGVSESDSGSLACRPPSFPNSPDTKDTSWPPVAQGDHAEASRGPFESNTTIVKISIDESTFAA
jgi:hypothetical protein